MLYDTEDDDTRLKLIQTTVFHLDTALENLFSSSDATPLKLNMNFAEVPTSYVETLANTSETTGYCVEYNNTSLAYTDCETRVHKTNYSNTCDERTDYSNTCDEALSCSSGYSVLKCSRCNECFDGRSQLNKHRCSKHVQKNPKPSYVSAKFKGSNRTRRLRCGKKFVRDRGLKNSYSCRHCHESFTSSTKLVLHVSQSHSTDRPFMCSLCEQTFALADELETHHNDIHLRYKCEVCREGFVRREALTSHAEQLHAELRPDVSLSHSTDCPFMCSLCEQTFASANDLETHHNDIHLRYKCEVCREGFIRREALASHAEQLHAELRPVKCMICDETLISASDLEHHLSVVHQLVYKAV